ncbi:hypothetical protein BG57_09880 [Caballeronia grimmiae]|uniref:Uncharacterized protein n=1 Tax=Caballeronia grimmiae TaxID=1071679 RepID=A0A069PB05_9BURK|nr:hypothetical protein BG57_09880 [Caballeronia grimmiae]
MATVPGDELHMRDWFVRIRRAGCYEEPQPKMIWDGCCYISCETPEPCPAKTLEYKVFDIDAEGRMSFYWDKLLYTQPPGRYEALVHDHAKQPVFAFGIQLCTDPIVVEQVTCEMAQAEGAACNNDS